MGTIHRSPACFSLASLAPPDMSTIGIKRGVSLTYLTDETRPEQRQCTVEARVAVEWPGDISAAAVKPPPRVGLEDGLLQYDSAKAHAGLIAAGPWVSPARRS